MTIALICQTDMTHFLSITSHFFRLLRHILSLLSEPTFHNQSVTRPRGTRHSHRTRSSLIAQQLFSPPKITVTTLIFTRRAFTASTLQREDADDVSKDRTGAFLPEIVGVLG